MMYMLMAAMRGTPLKVCRCGEVYYTRDDWRKLRLCGRFNPQDGTPIVELRNCRCNSTIGIELSEEEAPTTPPPERETEPYMG